MRFSFAAAAAVLLPALAMAEDLLFIDSLEHQEYSEAIGTLGLTAKVVTEAEWRAMTTADFAAFKAIVIADPSCGSVSSIQFLDDTKATWSPAVLGNMVLIGMFIRLYVGGVGVGEFRRERLPYFLEGKMRLLTWDIADRHGPKFPFWHWRRAEPHRQRYQVRCRRYLDRRPNSPHWSLLRSIMLLHQRRLGHRERAIDVR
jgi:hypothetical protein